MGKAGLQRFTVVPIAVALAFTAAPTGDSADLEDGSGDDTTSDDDGGDDDEDCLTSEDSGVWRYSCGDTTPWPESSEEVP
jgi:hypothetical protein